MSKLQLEVIIFFVLIFVTLLSLTKIRIQILFEMVYKNINFKVNLIIWGMIFKKTFKIQGFRGRQKGEVLLIDEIKNTIDKVQRHYDIVKKNFVDRKIVIEHLKIFYSDGFENPHTSSIINACAYTILGVCITFLKSFIDIQNIRIRLMPQFGKIRRVIFINCIFKGRIVHYIFIIVKILIREGSDLIGNTSNKRNDVNCNGKY